MSIVDVINQIPVADVSCSGGDCEYVLVADTPDTRKMLLDAGVPSTVLEQVRDPDALPDEPMLDVSQIAFRYGADGYSHEEGFQSKDRTRQVETRAVMAIIRQALQNAGYVLPSTGFADVGYRSFDLPLKHGKPGDTIHVQLAWPSHWADI